MSRPDLLELTPQALTALANAGFVKRAQKDVAAGLLPRIEMADDGEVVAHFDDGVSTRLPPGRTLRDASCTCPASGMCRHRVMLVLAYQAQGKGPAPEQNSAPAPSSATQAQEPPQAEAWTPAEFDDAALAQVFSTSVQAQASELAAQRPVIALLPGVGVQQAPSARLPMCSVRFFSRSSLAHARCDCKQGSGCAHVLLAVWAYQQAGPMSADAPERMVELGQHTDTPHPAPKLLDSAAARSAQQALEQLLQALWLDGASQPLLALATRFEALRAQVQALGWAWVDDGLNELWQLLQAHQARSSRFDAHRLLRVCTELWARLRAAAHAECCDRGDGAAPPVHASQILGLGVKGELALDHLRLVSLGAALWRSETAEGASLLFADPDTQTITVLEREWPLANSQTPGSAPTALLLRRVAGFPLRQLASGQVITKTAVRRANGLIDMASGTRQTGVMPLSPRSWDDLAAPLKHTSLATLRQTLELALPDFATPRQAATGAAAGTGGTFHVLASEQLQLLEHYWDAGAQVLHAKLKTEAEDESPTTLLHLALPHHAAAATAVDTLARALTGEWGPLRAIAGSVRLQAGQLVMLPLALLTAERGLALQAEPGAGPQQLALAQGSPERGAMEALTTASLDLLTLWLRQGLRHQSTAGLTRGAEQARRLGQAGLSRSANLMQQALDKLQASEHSTLLARLGALSLLLQQPQ